jgi:hypothetical protein
MDSIDTVNSDFKVQSIKILSEVSLIFFNQREVGNDELRDNLKFAIESQFFDV